MGSVVRPDVGDQPLRVELREPPVVGPRGLVEELRRRLVARRDLAAHELQQPLEGVVRRRACSVNEWIRPWDVSAVTDTRGMSVGA